MTTNFKKLSNPDSRLIEVWNRWENDSNLIPLIRPNKNKAALEHRENVTLDGISKRLENEHIFLIYLDDQLIGKMSYMVDPGHLYKKEHGTAWIAITIGESIGRGKGVGYEAIQYLEEQIKKEGINRIELGVFEFNHHAQKLYQKIGYKEIGRIENFTFWQGKMWADIRMEKYL
ncbi:GNAT family N-acetyltransferase [Bacillus sp. FJAT-49736]|uniref:GNAT family N-acetyltransferase n=1 Tax=Bacillus sp. FJAT-49736 TaxID=2833582 RepID=UPI001BC8EB3C|nr:GNAT family N-acetyltransferase [Bacillus sp. FJAT-49736]MBS4172173.1 GNAT family N-acetyltransferase [Bacillus sp. FJAT-49736]